MIHDHDSTSIPKSDGKGVVVGKKSDLQSMDCPHELPKWIILKWSMQLSLVTRAMKLGESASI